MKKLSQILLILTIILCGSLSYSQTKVKVFVANWNLENLYDVVDDPVKNDEEFLPTSASPWTQERLDQKLHNIAEVIGMMNSGNGPDILTVEEVEHQSLLDTLIGKYFSSKNYKIVYAESPDDRGIDVGIIYNANLFKLLNQHADTVNLEDHYPTRLILGTQLLLNDKDTLLVYANHWPSRRGGETESEKNRINAATVLHNDLEKYFNANSNVNVLAMGDFNDEPSNKSLDSALGAVNFKCNEAVNNQLVNLAYQKHLEKTGSYYYRGNWNMLDNIVVSKNLVNNHYKCTFEIFKPAVMVTKDGKYKDSPRPTFGGKTYLGGYSDHFPVTAVLEF